MFSCGDKNTYAVSKFYLGSMLENMGQYYPPQQVNAVHYFADQIIWTERYILPYFSKSGSEHVLYLHMDNNNPVKQLCCLNCCNPIDKLNSEWPSLAPWHKLDYRPQTLSWEANIQPWRETPNLLTQQALLTIKSPSEALLTHETSRKRKWYFVYDICKRVKQMLMEFTACDLQSKSMLE